jgi:hypothetical protein
VWKKTSKWIARRRRVHSATITGSRRAILQFVPTFGLEVQFVVTVNLKSQYSSKPVEEPRRKRWVTSKPKDDASVSSGGPHSHVDRKEMSDGSQV